MTNNYIWNTVNTTYCKHWLVLPTVYSDALSYGEQLDKFCYSLNQIIQNNNILPSYIQNMIEQYIQSGAIGEVVQSVLAKYILNVKYPPEGITPAVGDGTADDTASIQGCIDYAEANGGAVYFPYGSYLTGSITMKSNVSLFGFDRYSTKLVLKGGATSPMFSGNVDNVSIIGLTIDGNSGIQVNDVNLIDFTGGNYLFDNLIITDGFVLMDIAGTSGSMQVTNVVFGRTVKQAVVLTGSIDVMMNNVLFEQLSSVGGVNIIQIGTSNGTYNFMSKAICSTCLQVNGNNNTIVARILNATTPLINDGTGNNITVLGVYKTESFSGDVEKIVAGNVMNECGSVTENISGNMDVTVSGETTESYNGRTITDKNVSHNFETETFNGNSFNINIVGNLKYKTPTIDELFNYIPMETQTGTQYNVLVQNENTKNILIKADNVIYIYDTDNLNEIITNANNCVLLINPGNYTIQNPLIVNGSNVIIKTVGNVSITFQNPLQNGITFTGNNILIDGINFIASGSPQLNKNNLYYLGFNGLNIEVSNCSFNYISKYGIYVERTGNGITVNNCKFYGGWQYSDWDSTPPNGNFGIYCKFDNTNQFLGCNVYNSFFSGCVEGIYTGSYNAPLDNFGCVINGNIFYNMFDHGIYLNGGKANNITSNLFVECNVGIANEADYSTISNNTIYMAQNTLAKVGLSIRDAHYCSVTGNTIYGNIVANTGCIDFPTLKTDGDMSIIGNVISGNNIIAKTGSFLIRLGTSNTKLCKDNLIANNVFEGSCNNNYLVTGFSFDSNIFEGNIFKIDSNTTAAILVNGPNCSIYNNTVKIEFNADSTTICGLCVISNDALNTSITNNKVIPTDTFGENVTAFIVRETKDNYTKVIGNTIINSDVSGYQEIICNTPNSDIAYAFNNSLGINNAIPISSFATSSGTLTYNVPNAGAIKNCFAFLIPLNREAASALLKSYYITTKNGLVTVTFLADPGDNGKFKIIC